MARRLLITGANGMLGQKIVYAARQDPEWDILATGRGENRLVETNGYRYRAMDIEAPTAVEEAFDFFQPEVVINCAAITQVDFAEENQEACWRANVEAVETLLGESAKHQSHLIHISTDFVFDGQAPPYSEKDAVNPVNYYGESKAAAEALCNRSSVASTLVRTILVYGVTDNMSRSNAVLWAIRSLRAQKAIRVVADQYRTPTLVEDLAQGCLAIAKTGKTGTFHLSGTDRMSIYELVLKVADHFGFGTEQVAPVATAELNEAARRPPATSFDLTRAREELGYSARTFSEGLAIIARQIEKIEG